MEIKDIRFIVEYIDAAIELRELKNKRLSTKRSLTKDGLEAIISILESKKGILLDKQYEEVRNGK